MAEFRMYRTYRYVDKNPIIDKLRTIAQDEGVYKNLKALHEISGVSVAALYGWWHGDTRNPQHGTAMAVATSLGYEEQFVKTKDIDVAAERKAGVAWLEQREKGKPKTNGHRKPAKKRAK